MPAARYPSLYQINTRVWLTEVSRTRGRRATLDFVPNQMAPDHPRVDAHPEYFIGGSEADLGRSPRNYCRLQTKSGP